MLKYKQEILTPEMKTRIDAGFAQYAQETLGIVNTMELITFTAYDSLNSRQPIIAGVVCVQIFWGQLHIKYVYVDPAYRGRGIGSKLMENAFTFGREHNCTFAFVETMSFQAPEFYQKLGFVLDFTRSGYINEISYHYLKRDL
jgi:ribosomal protein S18 acetylase RimI-like enzyme